MKHVLFAFALIPGLAFAASDDSFAPKPPKPTQTTKQCKGIKVWDSGTKTCVNPQGSSLDADTLYGAVRELAYADRQKDAQAVLALMPDQSDDRVLTYWGFTHRKLGNVALAQAFYDQAIDLNPDNLLARSYMGQGYVTAGNIKAARAQLREIRARGGAGTWPEVSLSKAITYGQTFSY